MRTFPLISLLTLSLGIASCDKGSEPTPPPKPIERSPAALSGEPPWEGPQVAAADTSNAAPAPVGTTVAFANGLRVTIASVLPDGNDHMLGFYPDGHPRIGEVRREMDRKRFVVVDMLVGVIPEATRFERFPGPDGIWGPPYEGLERPVKWRALPTEAEDAIDLPLKPGLTRRSNVYFLAPKDYTLPYVKLVTGGQSAFLAVEL